VITRGILRGLPASALGLALARMLMLAVESAVTGAQARVLHLERHRNSLADEGRTRSLANAGAMREVPSLASAISSGGVGFAGSHLPPTRGFRHLCCNPVGG
jgi:hypothetical protein